MIDSPPHGAQVTKNPIRSLSKSTPRGALRLWDQPGFRKEGYVGKFGIAMIISGGQTGADRGGLDAAMEWGIKIGGWAPNGYKAEDGRIPEKYAKAMLEHSGGYVKRTKANVSDSDATLIISPSPLTSGSALTMGFAAILKLPVVHVALELSGKEQVEEIRRFLSRVHEQHPEPWVLNVAGPRESRRPGLQQFVGKTLFEALR